MVLNAAQSSANCADTAVYEDFCSGATVLDDVKGQSPKAETWTNRETMPR
jgi:hypothetical protein